jgi:tripartite-type tricarboxylate transporter receptor subunit TctC
MRERTLAMSATTNGKTSINRRRALQLGAAAAACAGHPSAILAQTFPVRPIKLVVPFPAGGSSDIVGRIVASYLAPLIGQSVVVENRAGAGGTLALTQVAASEADGHTLVQGAVGNMVFAPALMKPAPFDAESILTPVAIIANDANGVFVNAANPAKTLGEFEAWVRASPNPVPYGSAGAGTPAHIGLASFAKSRSLQMTHVPYRGAAPAITDLASNNIAAVFTSITAARGLLDAGNLRMLTVSSRSRVPEYPNVPTVREAGAPDMELAVWYGYFLANSTPVPIVERYHAAFGVIMRDAAFIADLRKQLIEPLPAGQSLAEAKRMLSESVVDVRRRIDATGVKLD